MAVFRLAILRTKGSRSLLIVNVAVHTPYVKLHLYGVLVMG